MSWQDPQQRLKQQSEQKQQELTNLHQQQSAKNRKATKNASPSLPTPNRNRARPQQTSTSHQRTLARFSTLKASSFRSPATYIPQSNNGTLWKTYGLDENSLTIRFLYSNLLLLEWCIKHSLSTSLPSMGVDIEHTSNRISRKCPKYSETSASSTSTTINLNDLIQAANICLEKRLAYHSLSDETFAKIKLTLRQTHTTIERTEQIHKTLDHLAYLPKHIKGYHNEQQKQKNII
ncbi:unnamed protein product [Rotaria sp. Silwood1]|nr:unnamed protein product [Rotaria sp. Silwood1]CAF1030759.1 unnamed protein product [Rotaria sp. Silwood1]